MWGYVQTFWEQFDWAGLLSAVFRVLGVLVCLTVHETCHGLAALAMLLLFFASLTARLAAGEGAALLYGFLVNTALLSVGLGLFNLVPIPPLDGSKVLFALLPERAYYTLMRYERYGMAGHGGRVPLRGYLPGVYVDGRPVLLICGT